MKKISLIVTAVAIAMGFTSCQKDAFVEKDTNVESELTSEDLIYETITASFEDRGTKTSTPDGGTTVNWEENDRVYYYTADNGDIRNCTITAAGASATLSLSRSSGDTYYNLLYNGIGLDLGDLSTRTSSKMVFNGVKTAQDGTFAHANISVARRLADSEASVRFKPVTALIKFTTGRTDIKSIVLTGGAGTEKVAGEVSVDPTADAPIATLNGEGSTSITVTIPTPAAGTYYINVLPGTYENGFNITLKDKDGFIIGFVTPSKTIDLSHGGDMINLGDIDSHINFYYTLVTNISELNDGDEVIIAAKKAAYAISITQNENNRSLAAITKENAAVTGLKDVEIFTLGEGTSSGTYSFYATKTEGYLAAASDSKNYMHTDKTLSAASSFDIEITDGTAKIAAKQYSRNHIAYNPQNSIFSCYASDTSMDKELVLYHHAGISYILKNIEITTAPSKTEYEAGESFNPEGMVVTAHYYAEGDGTQTIVPAKDKNVTASCTFDPSGALALGNTKVTVTYQGKTAEQNITVEPAAAWVLDELIIVDEPTKTEYTEGEKFNAAGMSLLATYIDASGIKPEKHVEIAVSDCVLTICGDTDKPADSTNLTTSDNFIRVSFTDGAVTKYDDQVISVAAITTATLTLSGTSKFGTSSGSTMTDDEENTWTVTTTNSGPIQNSYQTGYHGQQFGTKDSAWTGTFTCSIPTGKTVKSVKIDANTGDSATVSVTVGSTSFTYNSNNSASISKNSSANAATWYEFTGSASGNITITVTETVKAFYFGGVIVKYQ